MKFTSQAFAPELEKAIELCGYNKMTPIQQQAIPLIRRGKDVLANAQTGTGKTAAFALPILQRMINSDKSSTGSPKALILTPTRELAEQLADNISLYAKLLPFKVTALYGGGKMAGQTAKLKAGTDVLIATPGRLLEHITLCNVSLADVEHVVLDEADRMLDMGFITDVMSILQYTSKQRQTMLFSATMSQAVNELAHKILKNHVEVSVAKANVTADTIDHVMYPVEEKRKVELFQKLLEEQNWFQVLVFTSTKEQADSLLGALQTARVPVAICHGDIRQGARRRALADFKAAKIQVLIATEVAARGIDIKGLDCVVNFNLPYLPEDYVHRIGRTGRAGNRGQAISFVNREEEHIIERVEHLIGSKIKRIYRPGFEVSNRESLLKSIAKKPVKARTNKVTKTKIVATKKNKRVKPKQAGKRSKK